MQGYLLFRKEIEDSVEAGDTAIWMDESEIAPEPLKNINLFRLNFGVCKKVTTGLRLLPT